MNASTASTGNINRETAAPNGISPDSIPTLKEYDANKCVEFLGPPWVSTRTISKLANVTIIENNTVIEMIFLIIGMVTCINFCQALAPSIEAASYKSSGIDFNAAKYMIRKNGAPTQTLTNIIENRAQKVSLSQGIADNPSASNIQLKEL